MKKTYYSWECPPRVLAEGKILDFRVNLDQIFKGIKTDSFTELPKIIEFRDIEEKILANLGENEYCKIIADTNAYSLSPESIKLIGEEEIRKIFKQFREEIKIRCDEFYGFGKVKVVLFTDLIKDYLDEYKILLAEYSNKIEQLATKEELEGVKNHLKEHVGMKEGLEEFTKKVICSYIVEGIIIPRVLQNPIWINFDEPQVLANFTNRISKEVKIISKETLINKENLSKPSKEESEK